MSENGKSAEFTDLILDLEEKLAQRGGIFSENTSDAYPIGAMLGVVGATLFLGHLDIGLIHYWSALGFVAGIAVPFVLSMLMDDTMGLEILKKWSPAPSLSWKRAVIRAAGVGAVLSTCSLVLTTLAIKAI